VYKKYINPLKDVKQEKKPLNKIFSIELLNLLPIKKPTKNDPMIKNDLVEWKLNEWVDPNK